MHPLQFQQEICPVLLPKLQLFLCLYLHRLPLLSVRELPHRLLQRQQPQRLMFLQHRLLPLPVYILDEFLCILNNTVFGCTDKLLSLFDGFLHFRRYIVIVELLNLAAYIVSNFVVGLLRFLEYFAKQSGCPLCL